jgi:hypothetical protein
MTNESGASAPKDARQVEPVVSAERDERGGVGRKPFWLSWMHDPNGPEFEIHWPWWRSGIAYMSDDSERYTICAAVKAKDEADAKAMVQLAYDEKVSLSWRFCDERAPNWSPFSDRFGKADWMTWPTPPPPASTDTATSSKARLSTTVGT